MRLCAWVARWGVPPEAMRDLRAALGRTGGLVYDGPPVRPHADETERGAAYRLAVQSWGGTLMRNNNGVAHQPDGRPIRYGLGNESQKLQATCKSSDWIGIAPGGRFLAVEDKPPGWRFSPGDEHTAGQWRFLARVNELGGVGMFATHPDDIARELSK